MRFLHESHILKEILLINISGEDKPGLTASMTGILAGFDVNVLDIGQAVIHDTLSLGVLVELPTPAQQSSVLKDILFRTYELGMQVRFTPIGEESYGQQEKTQRHALLLQHGKAGCQDNLNFTGDITGQHYRGGKLRALLAANASCCPYLPAFRVVYHYSLQFVA